MPAKVVKAKPKPANGNGKVIAVGETRPIIYPELTVNGIPIPLDKMRLGMATLKKLLAWETEEDYKKRCEAGGAEDKTKGAAGYGDEFLLFDVEGRKVRCHNNLDNRPFDLTTGEKYAQDVLNRAWAGPSIFPGETVNGETIIIGRTGKVESGQHRGVGGILAAERWLKNPKNYPQWTEEPFLESLVVFGVSESPVIVRTLDNVRARTLADTVYTTDIFKRRGDGSETSQRERKELSRMLDAGIDLLWRRTGAGGENEPGKEYQTHSTSFDFLARHDHLKRFVKHLFETNANRQISLMQLSAGQCAAACYLMASGTTDVDKYLSKRDEKTLDWSQLDRAEEFWTALADGSDRSMKVVAQALGKLKSLDEGLGGRVEEKLAVLAQAWDLFRQEYEIKPEDLELAYARNDKGEVEALADPKSFGGIDQGHNPVAPDRVTPKQAEAAKKAAREKKSKEALDAVGGKQKRGQGGSALDTIDELRKDFPGRLLMFRSDGGDYNLFAEDAETVAKNAGSETKKGVGGVATYMIPAAYFETMVKQLMGEGHKPAVVRYTDGKAEVVDCQPRVGGKPTLPTRPTAPAPKSANGTAPPATTAKTPLKKLKKVPVPLKGGVG